MHDLRYAVRLLIKSPGFSLAAILTLGLAIGANTAIFSLVDAILLEPLPYPQADRLAFVTRIRRGAGLSDEQIGQDGRTWEAVRDGATTIDAAPAGSVTRVNLSTGDSAVAVLQHRIGAGYFGILGIGPSIGREFTAEEDRPNGPSAAILSARLWREAFHADSSIVGRTILLRGEPTTVVGVMPDGFREMEDVDVWTPLRPTTTGEGSGSNYAIVARLRPGVSWPAASAEMAAIIDPVREVRSTVAGTTITHGVSSLQRGLTARVRRPLLMLWVSVVVVLLLACVNLAGLLLARAGRRTREIATRLAIGGDRGRVIRQLLVESLLLAACGGLVGLLVGWAGLEILKSLADGVFVEWQHVSLDARALAGALGVTALTALAFGLIPALQASRLDVQAALVEGGTRAVAGGARGWPRRLLVVGEVALGVVLLVGAGLLLRTFATLQGLSPGFDLDGVVTASVSLDDERYRSGEHVQRLFDESLSRLRAAPEVESSAVALGLPYERILNMGVRVPGVDTEGRASSAAYVSDGFFDALRIPLLHGRAIDGADRRGSPLVVVVNDAFVKAFLNNRDPIGAGIETAGAARTVVGVVGNVRQIAGWGGYGPIDAMPTVYIPVSQLEDTFLRLAHTWFSPSWIVRGHGGVGAVASTVRRAIAETDRQLPIAALRDIDEVRAASVGRQRLLTALVGLLGLAALLLAAIGIHGLIATAVSERTRELGIRLALGSTIGQAVRTAALPGLYLTLSGLAIGVILALGATGLIRGLLWGVRPTDPATYVAVTLVLLLVAAAASLAPALRVRRFDPAALLRE